MTQHTPVLVGISHLEQRFTDFESCQGAGTADD